MVQWLRNLTSTHEAGSILGLAHWGKASSIAVSCSVDCRWGSDLVLLWLWLWRRPAAIVLIQPQAWEPPYAEGAAPTHKDQ